MRYRVTFNTHEYIDCSDRPIQRSRLIEARTKEEAREIVRNLEMSGRRYIGIVFDAEAIEENEHG